ncbi:MAG: hypothetical protein AMJ75_05375 [Phycisphaerae bacterium SM1_79]|nr:MAG: hypothetical protein AMJ75_05375 [Phycisphaerae bacterium SM1_79]
MQTRNIIRAILFVLFFSIGAAALSGSVLCDDLVQYYHNRQLLSAAQESLERLKLLNNDYDVLLSQLENDPNLVRRIARATVGPAPEDPNTVYPRATAELLAAARRALTEDPDPPAVEPVMPEWLSRCSEPRRKTMLFFSGVALILTSFICFGPAKQTPQKAE